MEEKRNAKLVQADQIRAIVDTMHQILLQMIRDMSDAELPRNKMIGKASLKCPHDKSPGDTIMFAYVQNPRFDRRYRLNDWLLTSVAYENLLASSETQQTLIKNFG